MFYIDSLTGKNLRHSTWSEEREKIFGRKQRNISQKIVKPAPCEVAELATTGYVCLLSELSAELKTVFP